MAIINKLVENHESTEIRFWCNRAYRTQSIGLMKQSGTSVKVSTIFAGKLRRYHGESLRQRLLDIPTIAHNIFDVILVALGFVQSLIKLLLWRPDVIFLKGGFVCLPVGYAAHILRIPIVIHDSDTHAGLTNRLLAPFAKTIATGAPLEYYKYPIDKAVYTGIPIESSFRKFSNNEKYKFKKSFGLPADMPLVLVVGGGLGAKKINDAMIAIADKLSRTASVVHLSGVKQFDDLKEQVPNKDTYKLLAFVNKDMEKLIGAADVVVSRSGASFMAELAAVGSSVILIPKAELAGGHQLKNASMYSDENAANVLNESHLDGNPEILLDAITELLQNESKRNLLSKNLHVFAKSDAAQQVAKLILKASE